MFGIYYDKCLNPSAPFPLTPDSDCGQVNGKSRRTPDGCPESGGDMTRGGTKIILAAGILALAVVLAKKLWDVDRIALAFFLFYLAASQSIDRGVAMRSGYLMIPQARQIDELIGPADHAVVNEGGETDEGVKEIWISEVYFGPRIRVDRRTSHVSKVLGSPEFQLCEIESVAMSPSGQFTISYRASGQREFSATDWEAIVESKGDFSVIGIQLEDGPDVANFDEWKNEAHSRAKQRYGN